LEAKLQASGAPAPRLCPNIPDTYRSHITQLAETLAQDDAAEARDIVRSLVESITLHPDAEEATGYRIEVRGALGAILQLAAGAQAARSGDAEVLSEQIKMVAGARYHLCRIRLAYPQRLQVQSVGGAVIRPASQMRRN